MDKSRQQFEAWFSVNQNNHLDQLIRDKCGNYFYIVTRTAWEAWQASCESLEVELPQRKGIYHNDYDCGYWDGIEKCEDILISSGVKIKNE
ncbi:hypothetical protein [Providencia rettgeri]|uniref:hypothetical protein n=1 Tax=Providencia rettgeri TaxID=587 RepID=UPI00235ECBFA|nr:hypothetical protein [Providencia rettgeri]